MRRHAGLNTKNRERLGNTLGQHNQTRLDVLVSHLGEEEVRQLIIHWYVQFAQDRGLALYNDNEKIHAQFITEEFPHQFDIWKRKLDIKHAATRLFGDL
jgi:hypothetical protein